MNGRTTNRSFYQLLLLLFEFQSGGIANVALFNKLLMGVRKFVVRYEWKRELIKYSVKYKQRYKPNSISLNLQLVHVIKLT